MIKVEEIVIEVAKAKELSFLKPKNYVKKLLKKQEKTILRNISLELSIND